MQQELDLNDLLSKKEDELNKTKVTLEGIREERDKLRRKVHKLLQELNWWQEKDDHHGSEQGERIASPVAKTAERIKLKKLQTPNSISNEPDVKSVIGKNLDPKRISSPVADHLAASLVGSSTAQELLHSLSIPNATNGRQRQNLATEFELKFGFFASHFQRLKAERNLLRLTLQETKAKMEEFQLLLLKYESNNAAYEQALFCCELIAESYDTFFNVLQDRILCIENLKSISTGRGKVWSRFLSVFDVLTEVAKAKHFSPHTYDIDQYMQDLSRHENFRHDITPSDLLCLPELIHKISDRKNLVKKAIVKIECNTDWGLSPPNSPRPNRDDTRYDLENAVLLLELSTVKEELHKLKCHYMSTYDDVSSTEQWQSDEENDHEGDSESGKHCGYLSLADLRIGTMTESEIGSELSESLKREEKLKKENEKLRFMLQQMQRNSEERHQKSMEVVRTLKTLYSSLMENTKREKSKHAGRVEELNRELASLSEDHAKDMKSLRRQIKASKHNGNTAHKVNETEL